MATADIIQLFDDYVMRTYGRFPLALSRGEGCRVWDVEGREYLDFVAGIAVDALGHGHPAMKAAVQEVLDSGLIHCSNLYYIESQGRLAQRLAELSGLQRAFFCNSGAEANEAAIKLARRWGWKRSGGERYEIIVAQSSFHGRTLGALAATGQPKYHEGFHPLPEGFRYVPYNDSEALAAAVNERTCAIMLEPVQGEGGLRPAADEYLQTAARLRDEHDLLLIFDEIQTGLGRTGSWFAFQHAGVTPDVLTLAKALGGGVPIGACLAGERAADALEPGTHATTFGGNPFVTRVALAVLDVMEKEDLPGRAARVGEHLGKGLQALKDRFPQVVDVRGRGLMWGLEWNGPVAGIIQKAMDRGLLLVSAGSNVVRFVPPLIVEEADVDKALSVLASVLEEEAAAEGA